MVVVQCGHGQVGLEGSMGRQEGRKALRRQVDAGPAGSTGRSSNWTCLTDVNHAHAVSVQVDRWDDVGVGEAC